jgi:hypothetical protein
MRVTGSDPSAPTTRTLLMLAPELAPNTLRAISPGETFLPADALAQAGFSVFRRMDTDGGVPCPLAPWRTSDRGSDPLRRSLLHVVPHSRIWFRSGTVSDAPIRRSRLSFLKSRPISRSIILKSLNEVAGCPRSSLLVETAGNVVVPRINSAAAGKATA